jgi:hypothetical protein
MVTKRNNPIVAERDDMIGRSASSARTEGSSGNGSNGNGSSGSAGGMSGLWKFLVLAAFFGLLGAGGFGWMEYQKLSAKHSALQERFELFESRLSSTDESVTQSGAAMQMNISKNTSQLKKHWTEIKKLWVVTNDINKGKIDKNQKDIAFLGSKRTALEKIVVKEGKKIGALSANYLGLSADVDATNESMRNQSDGLNRLKTSLQLLEREIQNNADGVKSMESFRRQTNQKIYALEQGRTAPATPTGPSE